MSCLSRTGLASKQILLESPRDHYVASQTLWESWPPAPASDQHIPEGGRGQPVQPFRETSSILLAWLLESSVLCRGMGLSPGRTA